MFMLQRYVHSIKCDVHDNKSRMVDTFSEPFCDSEDEDSLSSIRSRFDSTRSISDPVAEATESRESPGASSRDNGWADDKRAVSPELSGVGGT